MPNGTQTGRYYAHDRNTNDSAPIIGASLALPDDHKEMCNETAKYDMDDKCRTNYRNRLNAIMKYWKEHLPEYYAIGVDDVSTADQHDKTKYFFKGKYKKDLVYDGLNAEYFLYFLTKTKTKPDKKLKSWDDLRKYKDAIMWGSKTADKPLPISFYRKIEKFLKGYKKEFTNAKKKGNTEDNTSDPIPMTLYVLVLQWALDTNNIMVWFWTLSQWNCMARSASIDPLHFGNFSLGVDSIVVKYDDSKADKNAERLSEKNIFANPYDWRLCFWTGLCIWISLRGEEKLKGNSKLFLTKGVKDGTASANYCEQLISVVAPHKEEVENHMEEKRLNAYSFRKGSSTYAVAGTTVPPSLNSIARRGEWSIGKVLDCYWHFGSVGDQYLGRVLSGLDANSDQFDTLPPHWNMTNPMKNDDIKSGMDIMFGGILEEHQCFVPILVRSFACFVYHSNSLREQMTKIPGHHFNNISILHHLNRQLLDRLKTLVTLDPTDGVMTVTTGIPPHINHARSIQEVLGIVKEFRDNQQSQTAELRAAIHDEFEDRALESGHPTNERIQMMFTEVERRYNENLDERIENLVERLGGSGSANNVSASAAATSQVQTAGVAADMLFTYGGHFYFVPEHFSFPTAATLKAGIVFWFCGMDASTTGKRIRPFRNLKPKSLPTTTLRTTFKLHWCPIFRYLEKHVSLSLPEDFDLITNNDLKIYHDECIKVLRERVSFCFKNGKNKALNWVVSTWSKHILPSFVRKNGNDCDKELLLPSLTNRNNPSQEQKKRKRTPSTTVRHRIRQQRRNTTTTTTTTTTTATAAATTAAAATTTTTNSNNNNTTTTTTTTTSRKNNSSNHQNQRCINTNNNNRGTQRRSQQAEFGRINNDNMRRQLQAQAEASHQQQLLLRGRTTTTATTTTANNNGNSVPPTDVATAALESLANADAGNTTDRRGENARCDIPGCGCTNRLYKCRNNNNNCKKYVHHLPCGMTNNLFDPDNEQYVFCSENCRELFKINPHQKGS